MRIDYLIIGQGISGTWLSYFLSGDNVSFVVIDDARENASSRVAAGIINPVTGRRVVKTWMIDTLLPFAQEMYDRLGMELGVTAISRRDIIDFFSAPDMKLAFEKRVREGEPYVNFYEDPALEELFHMDFGCGMIRPAYTAHLENILPAWRKKLINNNQLREERFDPGKLEMDDEGVRYKDLSAKKILFCDGPQAAGLPFFNKLPFAVHKGEALLLEISGLPQDHIYKKGFSLVPMAEKNIFWLGSNYLWEYENDLPTEQFRREAEQKLSNWLKQPYRVLDHKAALRPANVERRPFVGFHPIHKNIGIFNGMGTKGCSLAPYFARQLADHLVYGKTLLPEADIFRFQKILSRN